MLVFISIITLVIGLFVGIMYPMIAKSYATGKVALKTAAARDIAFVIDSMYVYPYDIQIDYDYDLSDFMVKISDNNVEIYEASFATAESDPTLAKYTFVSVDDNPNFILDKPTEIVFKKENGILTVT